VAITMTKNPQVRKEVSKDVKQMVELPSEVLEEDRDPIAELMSQAQAAYESYQQAQRKVAAAYQEHQRQGEMSYKETEEHAAKLCAEAIEKAARVLEKAEQEAEEAYMKAKEYARRPLSKPGKKLKEMQRESGRPFRVKSTDRNMAGSREMKRDWRVTWVHLPRYRVL